jgi:GlcNAc-PI de-N-acetylase
MPQKLPVFQERSFMSVVAFYITAHQDDWQFFRGEQAFADLNTPDARIIFVYTTAGDAAKTDGWWEAREEGAIASVRRAIAKSPLTISIEKINNHPVTTYSCGNSISYFMRLPDGIASQSLSALRDGSISSLTAVDNSTAYNGWDDFCNTLETIVRQETAASSSPNPWINAPDYDRGLSPDDHADHKATADALRRFADSFCNRAWWVTYDIQNRPVNLIDGGFENKKALFFAYAEVVYELTTKNGNPEPPNQTEWNWWGNRSYCRLAPFGQSDS